MKHLGSIVESLALVVPKREGERVRKALIKTGALRRELGIVSLGENILFPVVERVPLEYPHSRHDFPEANLQARSYREYLKIPDDLRSHLPTSFDVVGDVLIVKLPEELREYATQVGSALLKANKGVATVAADDGVAGERRVRTLRVIAGRKSTRTVHREFGLEMVVDPALVYFSPRLAAERRRVAQQVESGETVLDAFCGVGPFTLHLAREGADRVYSIDSNPKALEFLRENVRRNRVENVVPTMGLVEEVVPHLDPVDRAILDFPTDPLSHLGTLLGVLRPGGVLHYYEILERGLLRDRLELLRESGQGDKGLSVLGIREVRGYSPSQAHYAIDLKA